MQEQNIDQLLHTHPFQGIEPATLKGWQPTEWQWPGPWLFLFMTHIKLLLTSPRIFLLYRWSKNLVGFLSISLLGTPWSTKRSISLHELDYSDCHFDCAIHDVSTPTLPLVFESHQLAIASQDPITPIVFRFPSSIIVLRSGLQRKDNHKANSSGMLRLLSQIISPSWGERFVF